jgi:hypothetical protein
MIRGDVGQIGQLWLFDEITFPVSSSMSRAMIPSSKPLSSSRLDARLS